MTEVDAFLDDLDRLAATAAADDPASFYRQLLPASGMALGASAAEYTPRTGAKAPPVCWTDDSQPSGASAQGPLLEPEKLQRLILDGAPRVVPGAEGSPVVACPVEGASGVVGLLAFRIDDRIQSVERSVELAAAVAETAARFELRCEAARVTSAETRLSRVESALVRLHSHRGLKATADEAAEQGRLLVRCDRLSVLARSGDRWRLLSVSGVARVSRRSDAARQIERLVRIAIRTGEPLSVPCGPETPPPVEAEVDRYCDLAGVRAMRVLPCMPPEELDSTSQTPRLAMLAEWFDGGADRDTDALLTALARHLGVAAQRDGGGIGGRWAIGRFATAAILATLVAAGAVASMLAPATLWTAVEGRFEPIDHARVFAPLDGVVEEVLVDQSEQVRAGQPLVRLASSALRLQQEEVAEAIAATEAELAALETAKLRASLPGRDKEESDPTTLASRVAAQQERLQHQRRRQSLLAEEEKKLVVYSPIDGSIVSWKPEDYLADRPVRRGQKLVEVAGDGRWRIELEAPDHRSGHLLKAYHQADEPLRVEYVVRSDPSQTHHGTVASVAEATRSAADGSPVVRVVVTPDDATAANPRSGLGVSAKIDCGEHSLAYAWLHEAIEAIRRHWF